jgi:cell wall-associated NlpC family hydrolase
MTRAERAEAGARATIGARFRMQGRDPALGLDCVGVVAVALAAAGIRIDVPNDYRMRRGRVPDFVPPDDVVPCDGARAGDVLMCRVSAAQLHLAVRTGRGVVHADAMLRRVVERPGVLPWPIERAWRLSEEG